MTTPRSSVLLFLLCALRLILLPGAHAQAVGSSALGSQIDRIIDAEEFDNAFWGIAVLDLESGDVIYERNARKAFVPASNTKLYSTSAALDLLGPAYVYRTGLYIDGPIQNGVLQGNLIVRGAADPTIGGHYDAITGRWEAEIDAVHLFREWADSLRAAGITRIEGDIIGDDDVVDDVPLGPGWSWDDETFYYSAQLSGLSFNDNVVHMHVESEGPGSPASIWWDPINTDYVNVINRTRTIHADSSLEEGYRRHRNSNTIEVSTLTPFGDKDIEEITVENPTRFFAHVLRETLQNSGIPVAGDAVDVDFISIKPAYSDPGVRRVAVHTSLPLSDIVRMVNKPSQNLYADMLIKTLAAEFPREVDDAESGSTELGLEVAMQTFVTAGIDTSRIQLADGSGLSRHNLVTPQTTVRLLEFMWRHPDRATREAFYESLPVAGVDGTLRNRMRSGPAHRNLRGKTGSLSNISSLSGYIHAADGTPLAFSAMSNHFTEPTRAVRRAQDRLASVLARYSKQP